MKSNLKNCYPSLKSHKSGVNIFDFNIYIVIVYMKLWGKVLFFNIYNSKSIFLLFSGHTY